MIVGLAGSHRSGELEMLARNLKCTSCGAIYSLNERHIACPKCGSVLDVEYDFDHVEHSLVKGRLENRTRSMWRYRELLPIAEEQSIVSMGEGLTPLRKAARYGRSIGFANLTMKLDYLNPTGSFKDRGTSVIVSKIKELEIEEVLDDSSGNAGASLAAYCAAAGVACTLYVPATAPDEKLLQAEIYGARIMRISGSRTDVAEAAQKALASSGLYYASHNLSPFFFEGMKTFAYEIAEDMGWQVPEHVAFSVGGGGLMAGAYKGFRELMALGWTDRIPKLHCIQSEACMPIVQAFRKGSDHVEPSPEGETIAGGIRISNPGRGNQVLRALKDTNAEAVSVTDEEILRHQKLLSRKEGMFAEPTSCAALAGLEKLLEMGAVSSEDSVVVPLTGFGLKDTRNAARALKGI
jgi:threonine synthase